MELSTLDLRYEGPRLRDDAQEARLRASIGQRGIEKPLKGVDTPVARILLHGSKRYRSAKKLGIQVVPNVSLGDEEGTGILELTRASKNKALGLLEQARFLVDRLTVHGMSVAEVAAPKLLEKTRAAIREVLFAGAFPVSSRLCILRPFRRMNARHSRRLERFEGPGRQVDERVGHRTFGAGLLQRRRSIGGGHRGRQAGLVARPTEPCAREVPPVRTPAAEEPATAPPVDAAWGGATPRNTMAPLPGHVFE
jgi:hypothetical protein